MDNTPNTTIFTQDPAELKRIIGMLEADLRTVRSRADEAERKLKRATENNAVLVAYHINNVLTVPEWSTQYAERISNSAVLSLIKNGDIDSVRKGRMHFIVMTPKTLLYRRSNRGPIAKRNR